ncbi:MAG: hypothetical protein V4462_02055 [Pseudomonadota bacterium]
MRLSGVDGAREQLTGTVKQNADNARRVTDIMQEISSASAEQIAGIEQIKQAIGQMDAVTQQNAALVEQAAGAEALQEQAAHQAQVVSVFRLDQSAAPAAVAAVAAPARRHRRGRRRKRSATRSGRSSERATATAAAGSSEHKPQVGRRTQAFNTSFSNASK